MSKNKRLDGYRLENGKICIELALASVNQLYDQRDKSPFLERDIDEDFADFIISSVQDFSLKQPMKLQLHIVDRVEKGKRKKQLTDEEICLSIRNYFKYMASITNKKLRKSVRNSEFFLVIGAIVLISCLLGVEFLSSVSSGAIWNILKGGIEIVGWVALWRPVESLLYDWYPMYENRKTLEKISQMEVSITDTKTEKTYISEAPAEIPLSTPTETPVS